MARDAGDFVLVWVSTPLAECERRDRKGLYARARAGESEWFTVHDGALDQAAGDVAAVTRRNYPDLVIPNRNLTLAEGAVAAWMRSGFESASWYSALFRGVAEHYGFSLNVPVKELPQEAIDVILHGSGKDADTLRFAALFFELFLTMWQQRPFPVPSADELPRAGRGSAGDRVSALAAVDIARLLERDPPTPDQVRIIEAPSSVAPRNCARVRSAPSSNAFERSAPTRTGESATG